MELFLGKGFIAMNGPDKKSGQGKTHTETVTETLSQTTPSYKIVLFNDEEHTYDYVVELLTRVCKLSRENSFRCAVEVDMVGRTIVYYGSHQDCEKVCSQILKYGPDHRLPHSMTSMNAEVQGH
jgi:ATP-dependent Clp protease adaptor protein ClpS